MPVQAGQLTAVLLADVEGSSRLWDAYPVEMRKALSLYDEIYRRSVETYGGEVTRGRGEGESVVGTFSRAVDAVTAALAVQLAANAADWPTPAPFRIRTAVHVGESEAGDGTHFGPTVNRAARLRAIGHGGQILLSDAIASLVRGTLPSGSTLRDLGTHRLPDLSDPLEVFQLVHPDLKDAFPSLQSLSAIPNNLPHELTPFVGRSHELSGIKELIEQHRLVTLTGTGGTGKTRIATQVANELLQKFPDGVYLVELATVTDDALVGWQVANAMGLPTNASESVVATLSDHLRHKEVLIVLDNCEHVVSACADLAAGLLRYTDRLRIVATSREILAAAGEMTWQVPPMSTPGRTRHRTPDELLTFESVQLFLARARAVSPAFQLTPESAPAVAEICHRLDGIPLAIELAAARVSALAPDDIATRLTDRFRLLKARSRTSLPRQQTLRALIDWSFDLLSEEERIAWRRLSVFAGSFALEDAEAVIASDDLDAWDVMEYLTRLVEKSLLLTVPTGNATRYRMLETIREYGHEKLREAGEVDRIRRQWWTHYGSRAREFIQTSRTSSGGIGDLVAQMRQEEENLLAALDAMLAASDTENALNMANVLGTLWFRTGDVALGKEMMERVLSLPDGPEFPDAYVGCLTQAGFLEAVNDRGSERAVALLELARDLGAAHAMTTDRSTIDFYLGQALFPNVERARPCFEEMLTLAGDNPRRALAAHVFLAACSMLEGDLDAARRALDQAEAYAKQAADVYQASWVSYAYSVLLLAEDDWEAAHGSLQKALSGFRDSQAVINMCDVLPDLALCEERLGRPEAADAAMAEHLATAMNHNLQVAYVDIALLCSWRGAHESAVVLWTSSRDVHGYVRDQVIRDQFEDEVLRQAREALGDKGYQAAVDVGQRMRRGDRLAYTVEAWRDLQVASASEEPEGVAAVETAGATPTHARERGTEGADAIAAAIASAGSGIAAMPSGNRPSGHTHTSVDRGEDPAYQALSAMSRLSLRECAVIGSYRRYDERARNSLRDWQRRISDPLRSPTTTHDNFLIWAAPGSGKSFLIQETARALGDAVSYFELNLARLGREEWVQGLREVRESTRPALVLLDEIDARADEVWTYEECFSLLDLNLGNDRNAVFVLIGSSTSGIDGMVGNMLKRSKAKDMLDRVPMDRRFEVAAPIVEDKAVILTSQILDAAASRRQVIEEVEKFALYYALTDESLQTPRQLRDLAVAAVQRLPQDERRLKYDDLFYRGDKRNQAFWMKHSTMAEELAGLYVRLE